MACEGEGEGEAEPQPIPVRWKKKEWGAEVFTERVKDASAASTASSSIPKTGESLPESLFPSKNAIRLDGGWSWERWLWFRGCSCL